MFCKKCNAMLPDGTKFCTFCGAPQSAPEFTAPVNAPVDQAPAQPAPIQQPQVQVQPQPQAQPQMQPTFQQAPVQPQPQVQPAFQQAPVQPQPQAQPQVQPVFQQAPVQAQPQMQPAFPQAPVQPQPQAQPQVQPAFQQAPVQPQPQVQPQQTFQQAPVQPQNYMPQSQQPVKEPKKKGKGALIAIIIIIIIAVLAIGGCLFYLFVLKKDKENDNYQDAVTAYLNGYVNQDYQASMTAYPNFILSELEENQLADNGMSTSESFSAMLEYAPYTMSYTIGECTQLDKNTYADYEQQILNNYGETVKIKSMYLVNTYITIEMVNNSDSYKSFDYGYITGLIDDTWYLFTSEATLSSTILNMAELYMQPLYSYYKSITEFNMDYAYDAYAPFDDDLVRGNIDTYYESDPSLFFGSLFYGYSIDGYVTEQSVEYFTESDIQYYKDDIESYYSIDTPNITNGCYLYYDFNYTVSKGDESYSGIDEDICAVMIYLDGQWYVYQSGNALDLDTILPEMSYSYDEYTTALDNYLYYGLIGQDESYFYTSLAPWEESATREYLTAEYGTMSEFFEYFYNACPTGGYYTVLDATPYDRSTCYLYERTIQEMYGYNVSVTMGYEVNVGLNISEYDPDTYDTLHDYYDEGTMTVLCIDGEWMIADTGYYAFKYDE